MKPEQIVRGFDFVAPYYDLFSYLVFQKRLLRAQTHYFGRIGKAESILIFGGGTGKILLPLSQDIQFKSMTFLDISPRMIAKAVRCCNSSGIDVEDKIEFIEGSTEKLSEGERYDLIITPFVLDCFSDESLRTVIAKLDQHLEPGGIWLFTDFNEDQSFGFISNIRNAFIKFLYFVFNLFCPLGITQLPKFGAAFSQLNYGIVAQTQMLHGLVVGRIYQKPGSTNRENE